MIQNDNKIAAAAHSGRPLPVWTGESAESPAGRASLTTAEASIWAGQRLDGGMPLYNMSIAFHIDEALEPTVVQRALQSLAAERDILRTVYVFDGTRPVPIVREDVGPSLQVLEENVAGPSRSLPDALAEAAAAPLSPETELTRLTLVPGRDGTSVLILTQHHLVTDAWSMTRLFGRLGELYRTLAEGRDPAFEDVPQFAARRHLEQGLRSSPEWARAQAFWQHASPPEFAKRHFYGKPAQGRGESVRTPLPLNARQSEGIRQLVAQPPFRGLSEEQSGFTFFASILAAWMHRTGDRQRVTIGVPFRMRPDQEARETSGLFVELFPLSIKVEREDTFEDLARRVKAALLKMSVYALPGASAGVPRDAFDVVLNYIPQMELEFGGRSATAEWVHPGFVDPSHVVRLHVHGLGPGPQPNLDVDLSTDVFGPLERGWFNRHFSALMDAAVRNPDTTIGDVDITTWDEAAGFVPTSQTKVRPGSILELFQKRVDADPDAPAIEEGETVISYRALDERSRRAAAGLSDAGAKPGDLVGISIPRSADYIVAMLAVLRSGAAFVPIDPDAPAARNDHILKDAGTEIIVHSGADGHGAPFPSVPGRETAHESLRRRLSLRELELAPPRLDPNPDESDLAYVLYTSGSTGQPKGVEVTHGNLADYVSWAAECYGNRAAVRLPFFTSPAFDLTLTSLLVPLVTGGSVVVYRDHGEPAATTIQRVFEENRVDVVKLTPSHLMLIRDSSLKESRVRGLVLGGEELPTSLAAQALASLPPGATVYNEYGPTEATVACLIHRFDPAVDTDHSVPIGRPTANVGVHVLDHHLRPTPRGVVGEICVSGARVARGYRNLPQRTKEVFLEDPSEPGVPMYRTGDFGRWTPDGTLHFLGRRDNQVKIRGARIELGEVESALGSHPDVDACAAYLIEGPRVDAGRCTRCGLESAHPRAQLDGEGVCAVCRRFEAKRDQVASYFGTMGDLEELLAETRSRAAGLQDCLMLLSGGKDSTYALCKIVEMGARPLVFMLDNGFISDQAKANARRVVDQLGLELILARPEGMEDIFRDSLERFSNVCEGCFKTIYTLAVNLAHSRGLRTIVTGLSRGQIFETRLQDLYRRNIFEPAEVEATILSARKAYHRMDDAVSRLLDVSLFETEEVFDEIRFLDFYRYCDDPLDVVLEYIGEHTPWIRPSDTGRSTNCLINEAGIYVHKTERGFHNYSMPYSWDVRLGHKKVEAAVEELDDDLDPENISRLLGRVAYQVRSRSHEGKRLAACYVGSREIPVSELRKFMAPQLPPEALPGSFLRLDTLPMGEGGKLDRSALPQATSDRPLLDVVFVPPRNTGEEQLATIWREVLGLDDIGVHDNFFEIGGDSMHCVQIVAAASEVGLRIEPRDLFDHPTVAGLADVAMPVRQRAATPEPAVATAEELEDLQRQFGEF